MCPRAEDKQFKAKRRTSRLLGTCKAMKTLLAIDTATDRASVALSVGDDILEEQQLGVKQHAQYLLPMIERLLAQAGLMASKLDGVVFGCGPGSFTGLRIACSAAKALAYAHGLPMYSVNSLTAIAYGASQKLDVSDCGVLAIIDARMRQVYWAYYPPGEKLGSIMPQVNACGDIVVPVNRQIVLAGVGFESYLDEFSSALRQAVEQQHNIFPDAKTMIQWVMHHEVEAVSALEAEPLYVRNQVVSGGY